MTTTVIVKAHCSSDKEVRVDVVWPSGGEYIVLQDGESAERVVFDERSITIKEVAKSVGDES